MQKFAFIIFLFDAEVLFLDESTFTNLDEENSHDF